MKDIDTKRPSRLDLNAPLLSTRRSNITCVTSFELSRAGSLHGSSDRVPFSWEQSPGKPKNVFITTPSKSCVIEGNNIVLPIPIPIPKPPLVRWQEEDDHKLKLTSHDNNAADACFSDAIDLFSLEESSLNTSERLDFESEFNENSSTTETWSPNFMIQRFLPAATALAASSLSAIAVANKNDVTKHSNNNNLWGNNSDKKDSIATYTSSKHLREGSRVVGEAYSSSSRGCGFHNFFPWRAKYRLCGVKSPVKRVCSNQNLNLA
ncbi:ESX-5 secretion system protein EccC5 [Bienertia sinuspersici]